MTSHAAAVVKGMGKCGITGCAEISVDYKKQEFNTTKKVTVCRGQLISLDGSSGEVMLGDVDKIQAQSDEDFKTILKRADKHRHLQVRVNAENPEDVLKARELGAEGIGLCRTEHMFFDQERILAVREMIFSKNVSERKDALRKILPFQKKDFEGIFAKLNGLPCNIRLLDPPLHEVRELCGKVLSKTDVLLGSHSYISGLSACR